MDQPRFTIFEPHVAESFGVSRLVLAELRKNFLTQGTDWDFVQKKIFYTKEAVEKISARMAEVRGAKNTPELPEKPAPTVEPLPIPEPAPEIELVVRRAEVNPHIVTAFDDEKLVRVRVKENANFVQGMKLRARLMQAPDLYELVGRCPRRKGQW